MKNRLGKLAVILLLMPAAVQVQAQEPELKDTPWFSGMPSYLVYDAEDVEFDSYDFFNGKNCVTVEGKKFKRTYTLKEEAQKSSVIQIMRNYSNAIKNMGGTIIYEGAPQEAECADHNGINMVVGKVVKDGNEMWVEVASLGGDEYYLTLVLKELMKQDVTASSMLEALNRDGHIAIYINFDTGKSMIRDESKPIIGQIVQMMKSNPELKLNVEGHTDNAGTPASNKTLSEARAKSVVSALVSQGIAADRLSPVGYGQDKPIADNNTEEGKAKNRRVELVKR
ncbi:MAG: OmpA/MotB domain protein [Candidatus Aminicenantes bacterium]|nr:OmpA/MotB domain protein [Candidatus Aminicenantes bacterium]